MICLELNEEMDVCITIEARVIVKKKPSGSLEEEVLLKDTRLRAEYIGRQFEAEIVEKVRKQLAAELGPESGA
ncbi:MAG: hypothetical protein PVG78_01235 [Desulfobacterales bacterium]|jgi:hypothetical protein